MLVFLLIYALCCQKTCSFFFKCFVSLRCNFHICHAIASHFLTPSMLTPRFSVFTCHMTKKIHLKIEKIYSFVNHFYSSLCCMLPDSRKRERPQQRVMDVGKEDMQRVGVTEEG